MTAYRQWKTTQGHTVIDEWCQCGNLRSEHADTPFSHGHGPGPGGCERFSFRSLICATPEEEKRIARRARAIDAKTKHRFCKSCGDVLKRRTRARGHDVARDESLVDFAKRRFCNKSCASHARGKSVRR